MKEIGVRKVLGASVFNLLGIFGKEIIILMGVAFVLASPVAYYLLKAWLSDFRFSINISPDFFIVSLLASLVLALVTISHRTIVTAMINPATTLKDE